jgi:hypothetical protein
LGEFREHLTWHLPFVTLTDQTSPRRALVRALLSLLVLALTALTAASASAAVPDPAAAPAPSGSDPAPVAASAPAPPSAPAAPDPTVGTASGGAQASPPPPAASPPEPSPMPTYDEDVLQPQPVVISKDAGDAPIGRPTHDAPSPPAPRPNLEVPIVATSHRVVAAPRATVTQLASGGPFITAAPPPAAHAAPVPSAAPATTHAATTTARQRGVELDFRLLFAQRPAPPTVVGVSVPLVDVYISSETTTRHPGEKSSPQLPLIGPAGLGATTLSPFGSAPLQQPGGPALFANNAPTSSSGGSSSALLGLNAMLAAMTLLAGISWRRRSWAWPVLSGESALLASALDRPG